MNTFNQPAARQGVCTLTPTIKLIPVLAAALLTACSSSPVKTVDDGLYGIKVERNWVIGDKQTPEQAAMDRAEGFCSGQGGKHAVAVKELARKDNPNLIGEVFSEYRMLFECLPNKSDTPKPRTEDALNRIYGL